jgi:ACS family sodium-dependent inorganic phosphate cotransporter
MSTAAPSLFEYWPRRLTVVILCFLSALICYIDRVNISVAIIPMAEEFGWDNTTRGLVLSSFFYGYMATQVLGGWLADRFGAKAVLGFGVLWWSLFTLVTPPAAAASLAILFVARALMGMGEGINFPACYSVMGRWIPASEKARAAGFLLSGVSVGTVAALLISPILIGAYGWESVFYIYGVLGFIWWIFWQTRVHSLPSEHPNISEAELEHIRSGLPAVEKAPKLPFKLIFSKVPVWALIINHFCVNWGFYVMLAWLPTYFNQQLGVNIRDVGIYAVLPYVALFITGNGAGWISDWMIKSGWSVTNTRKVIQTIGLVGPASCFFMVGQVETPLQGVAVMTGALFFAGFSFAGFAVNHLDIAPKYAGTLLGITNTVGTIPGVVGVLVSGYLVDTTGSWASAFFLAACLYLVAAVVWLLMSTGERIID